MSEPAAIDSLAVRVCQVVRAAQQDQKSWISIDCVHDCLGPENLSAIDAAVAFAKAKGWLAITGRPAYSVLLKQGAP